jgi:membrane peptidoglycan carboxypeptidase
VAAEDGGFYHHRGFDLEGFNYALIRNLKDKKLGRGGSTITMQLVKNVYLNRNKTLSRKGEEALIVWLIESQRLLEKERILEIYLNIIEWGPDIYGVTEAAEFYFEKDPADITLNEAIFLTSIIPRPKQFMYYFDNNGNLKDFMEGYFSFVGKTLLNRGLITDSEFENLTPNITITGRAVNLLRNQNTNGSINEFEADDLLDIEN